MSSLLLGGVAIVALVLGYIFYSPKVSRWIGVDENRRTPAVELEDGQDYVPAKHWTILFGHHFASIAGAAPIIGPVIACFFWGWVPAVIWLVLGGIFFGAVHDFISLVLSTRHKGESIATVTEAVLGKTAKIVFSLFVLLALILVVAVFAAVAGKTLASTPEVVIPTFGLIFVAMAVGFMMYHMRVHIAIASVIGLALLFGLIVAGYYCPVGLAPISTSVTLAGKPFTITITPTQVWTVLLLVYGLVASVTPVTILLQPRDHLAAGVLFVGMFLGFAGIAVSHPAIKAPAFVSFTSTEGYLWPMLFVTVACGAVSGFHSLVASGTTSKQLPRMKDARIIGYGGMITESALSILAVLAVCAGLHWKAVPEGETGYVYQEVFKGGNWINAFGKGYGELTSKLLGVAGLSTLGALIGITMLKTFVMTTLDSATRITRYVCSELLGDTFHIRFMRNKYAATLLVGVLSGALALGNWKAIWPVFGASNQLIASLVFLVAAAYLMSRGRRWLFAVIPAALMLITTLTALVFQLKDFLTAEEPKYLLAGIAVVLIALAAFILVQSVRVFLSVRSGKAIDTAEPHAEHGGIAPPHV